MVRTILNIQLLFYGMTYQMILEKMQILTNLKTFYYLGIEMNANVMHVKNLILSRSFQFLYYLYVFNF